VTARCGLRADIQPTPASIRLSFPLFRVPSHEPQLTRRHVRNADSGLVDGADCPLLILWSIIFFVLIARTVAVAVLFSLHPLSHAAASRYSVPRRGSKNSSSTTISTNAKPYTKDHCTITPSPISIISKFNPTQCRRRPRFTNNRPTITQRRTCREG